MTWQKSLRTKVNKQLIDVMTVSAYVYHLKLCAKECRKKDAMHYL
jgi:hypothetical protein